MIPQENTKTRKKIIKLWKLFSGLSLGIFLNQGINLILIPFFWKSLKPEDFGIIAICQMVSYFLSPVYMFGASETIQRFYYTWSDEERPHRLSSFFWFIFGFTLILTVLLDIFGTFFSRHIIVNVPFHPLVRYTLWSAFLTNLMNIPLAISRIKQTVLSYNILLNGSFITQIGLVIYFVKFLDRGAAGYIEGFFVANCIWFLPTLILTFKDSVFIPDQRFRKLPLNYATPLTFAGIVDGFSTTLDRFYLDKFVPLSTIGFYNLGRQIGSLVNVINSVTKLIAVPLIYKKHSLKQETVSMLGHAGFAYSVIMLIPVVFVSTLSTELISILDPSRVYLQITPYIPYFAVSFYFVCIATITGRGMDLVGITKWSFTMPLAGATVSLIGYTLFLPEHGVWGVLWSMLLGAFARNFLYVILAYFYLPRNLYLKKLCLTWLTSFICFEIAQNLGIENVALSALAKIGVLSLMSIGFIFLIRKHVTTIFKT